MNQDTNYRIDNLNGLNSGFNPKIKVCHFSSVHHVWDTRVFYRECSGLANDFDVTLIAIGEDGNYIQNGVNIISIPKPGNFIKRFSNTIFKVFYLAVKQDAQIYHIHDAEMVPFAILLRILGKQVIYDIHENTHDDILLKPWLNKSLRSLLAFLYNVLLWVGAKFLHYIVVIGDPKLLPRFFVQENQSTIIQNFADPEQLREFRVLNRGELPGNHLFYVGMIRDMYYSIDPVLEAIYLLKQKGIECHLHLIGYFGSKTNASLKDFVHWKEIQMQVSFYGFLPMKEAFELSKKCKIGLCIKNQPESMLFSHERKLFEYMAIGLPSVFCNQSMYSSLNLTHNIGVSLKIDDAETIANGIAELLSKPIHLNELCVSNLYAAENHFNWQLELKKLKELYLRLANS